MPRPCWGSAHSSLPPSAWWIMEVWIVVHAYYQLFIHSVMFIEWVLTLICSSGHMTSIVLSILERDPPLLLSWRFLTFFPLKGYLGVVPDPMWGQRSGMSICTDCKALWDTFVIRENGLYKYTELNKQEIFIFIQAILRSHFVLVLQPNEGTGFMWEE